MYKEQLKDICNQIVKESYRIESYECGTKLICKICGGIGYTDNYKSIRHIPYCPCYTAEIYLVNLEKHG